MAIAAKDTSNFHSKLIEPTYDKSLKE